MIIYGIDFQGKVIPVFVATDGKLLFDPSSLVSSGEPLLTDGGGRLVITASSPTFFIPTPKTVFFSNLTLPAGTSTQTVATVPTGEIWKFTYFSVYYIGTVAGVTLTTRIFDGTSNHRILYTAPPVSDVPITLALDVLLSAGNRVEVVVTGATLNNDLVASVFAQRVQ